MNCKYCNTGFDVVGNKRYCSKQCQNAARNDARRNVPKDAKCAICEKSFIQKRKDNVTCSPSCSQKLWAINNPEKNWNRCNSLERKAKVAVWVFRNKERIKKIQRKYKDKKRATDIQYKLKERLANLIRDSLRKKGCKKSTKTTDILGCSIEEFKRHIESKFLPWMNWNNYGKFTGELDQGWDIDHIIPLSTAKTEEDILKLNHFSNLQPLCSKINRHIKRDNP